MDFLAAELDFEAVDRFVVELDFLAAASPSRAVVREAELLLAAEDCSASAAAAFSSVDWDAVVGTMTFRLGRVKAMD
ncbi:hypothetical protein GCM10027061_10510 [Nesterenkonia suensis]